MAVSELSAGRSAVVEYLGHSLRAATDIAFQTSRSKAPNSLAPIGAAHGLVFGGGIPPGVDDQHVVGGSQIQAEATGLQADEEEVAHVALKAHHSLAALGRRRAAVQILVD